MAKYVDLTASVVAAFVENNRISIHDLPSLISGVHQALNGIAEPAAPETAEKPTPAKVRASIKPDGLVSFIDGKRYAVLKRHLTTHGLTPAEYRERFGLPDDYPMVAPSYAAKRSELAKSMGLGRRRAAPRRATQARK
jgi:predicted transcriptional regulator